MTTVKISYGSETSLTFSGAIASSATAGRQSNTIDNTATLADDYVVAFNIVYPASAPANDKTVYIWGAAYIGATIGWQGRPVLTGSDAAYTFNDITTTPTGLQGPLSCYMVNGVTGTFVIPSLAVFFGGNLPIKAAFALANYSGQTITTFTCTYLPVFYTNA